MILSEKKIQGGVNTNSESVKKDSIFFFRKKEWEQSKQQFATVFCCFWIFSQYNDDEGHSKNDQGQKKQQEWEKQNKIR